MQEFGTIENSFLSQITALVEKNIMNEQFGVSELAEMMNMSRSNLLRKVKKETNLSVSQLISQVRLKRAMEILKNSNLNVSEVSFQVGFSSISYFIKCFREYYGYPPGEVGKREEPEIKTVGANQNVPVQENESPRRPHLLVIVGLGLIIALAIGIVSYIVLQSSSENPSVEKSIVILPFKNDSNDSSNIYLINGLMESTLNNLQKIKDLKVISRTSAEKYRNTGKSIPEMARELNVIYFVEGSGQKIGNRILLNVQLIEGPNDKHLWAKQYRREAKDIFELQEEISKNIAEEIQAVITPEEKKRIEKKPTENLVAYDLFLKGRDSFYKGKREDLEKALPYYKKAIEHDKEFALAYADVAIVYYFLDIASTEKKYGSEISSFADKAFLFDSKLPESLVAKALSYAYKKDFQTAIPYFEKAFEYNPNSGLVLNFLSDFYNFQVPNTTKYLQYSLKSVKLHVEAADSVTTSYNYLRLSDALLQTGFIEEALKYIDKSLDFNPKNPYSNWVKIFILFAKSRDLKQTRELLVKEIKKDTTQFIIVEEIGKVCYLMRDYQSAYKYYKKFMEMKKYMQLDIFKHENLKIAITLSQVGMKKESDELLKSFKEFADADQSIYKNLHLVAYYSYLGNTQKAMDHFRMFSKEENFQYWVLLMRDDPSYDKIKTLPEFKQMLNEIEKKFWNSHNKLKSTLKEEQLI